MNQAELIKFLEEKNDKFAEMRKDLKYFGNSFDIVCQHIEENVVMNKLCFEHEFSPTNLHRLVWCQFPFKEQRARHDHIKRYFEAERGDLEVISDPSFSYLMCANLWGKGMTPTNKWVVVGCMSVGEEEIIDWIWVHPTLRKKGLTKLFLTTYCCHAGPLIIQPPVSDEMQNCLKSVQAIILADPELKTKYYSMMRTYLSNLIEENLSYLNDESIQKVMQGLSMLSFHQDVNKTWDPENRKKVIKAMAMTTYCVQQNPGHEKEMLEHLIKMSTQGATKE